MDMGPLELGPIVRAAGRQKSTFALVVLQLASGFLVAGSLLNIGWWFRNVGHASSGFDEADLIGLQVREPRASLGATTGPSATETGRPTLARVAAVPGVMTATRVSPPLRAETGAPTLYRATGPGARAWTIYTTPALLSVLGLKIVEGSIGDGPSDVTAPPVMITRWARDRLFAPGEPAVGRLIVGDDSGAGRVVGVLEDFRLREPFWDEVSSIVLRFSEPIDTDAASFVVRGRPGQRAAVEERLRALATGAPGSARLGSTMSYAAVRPRFQKVGDGLVLLFIDIGLTVSAIALVGAVAVSSFVVAARRHEIGIRRALGATRGDILRYFVVESTLAAAVGIGIGLAATVALLFGMRSALVGLPIGSWQLGAAAAFMWVNATAAALLPARHATRVSPTLATRGG